MKKRILAIIITAAVTVFATAGLVSCDSNTTTGESGTGDMKARDVYAMSLVSGISYLSSDSSEKNEISAAAHFAPAPASVRPESITDADVEGIKDCILMFEKIIAGGGVEEVVKENTSSDPAFAEYKLEMTISLHNPLGEAEAYTLYFNETGKKTDKEIDEGILEIEESTIFEGVAVFGEEIFIVRGVSEVETEGGETETSIEFRTYKSVGTDTPVADEKNYVQVEKSTEFSECEYEYTFVEGGRVIREIEIEYEETKEGVAVSFETESANGESSFEIKSAKEKGNFIIKAERGNTEDKISAILQPDGSYRLSYSNGFEEYINKS